MNEIDERIGTNPFSSTAVAATELAGLPPVTVLTQAVETATELLTGYLRPDLAEVRDGVPARTSNVTSNSDGPETADSVLERSVGSRPGRLLVISGDYGTGKTHLANYLLRTVKRQFGWAVQRPQPQVLAHCGYVAATAGGFEQLYHDFLASFHREELTQTVDDSYADIVADALDGLDSTQDIAIQLRSGQLDAAEVVEELDLIDSLLARQLRAELGKIAKRADLGQAARSDEFGDALTLLLLQREQLGSAVWDWLHGSAPSTTLVSRGIVHPIRGEAMALQALGVFAYLFGRCRHRFVLAIDELDRILTSPDPSRSPVSERFRKLLETFDTAGTFLIIAALPDLFEKLGGSARQRPGQWLDLDAFNHEDIRKLIMQMQSGGRLEPFTDDAPKLIHGITGGIPRQVIRLCHRAWQLKLDRALDVISPDVVLAAAKARTDFPTRTVVRNDIRSILQDLRLPFRQQYWHPEVFELIDFWVTGESDGANCAIVITNSIVTEDDATTLINRALKLHPAAGDDPEQHTGQSVSTLLVATGHLHLRFRERIIQAFESEPLQYGMYDFRSELGGTVSSALARTGGQQPQHLLQRLQAGIGRLTVQQAHSQDYLDRMALRLDELNATVSQIPATLLRDRQMRAEAFLPVGMSGTDELPRPARAPFEQVLRALGQLMATVPAFRTGLDRTTMPADLLSRRERLWPWLGADRFYRTVGVLSTLRDLVLALQTAVTELHERHKTAAPSASAAGAAKANLHQICDSYDMMLDHITVFDLAEYPVTIGAEPGTEDIARDEWLDRWGSVNIQLQQLGAAVMQTNLPLLRREGDG